MELIDFAKPIIHNADSDDLKFIIHDKFARDYSNDDTLGLYLKLANKKYNDKIFISRAKVEIADGNTIIVDFTLPKKATGEQHLKLQFQLQSEDGEFVEQTKIVELCLGESLLDTSDEVKNIEPNRLAEIEGDITDLDERVTALEEGGGGGTVDSYEPDVCVKRVWLSYDDTLRAIFDGDEEDWSQQKGKIDMNFLMDYNGKQNNPIRFNNPDWIYVNIVSTPIGKKTKEEIERGTFVLRFDYPIGHNTRERYKPNGAGVKSFAYNFDPQQFKQGSQFDVAEFLKKSLIFVDSDDIKINNRGEEYIHIVMTYRDFAEKMWNIETRTFNVDTNDPSSDLCIFDNNYVETIFGGIPECVGKQQPHQFFMTQKRYGYYVGANLDTGALMDNVGKGVQMQMGAGSGGVVRNKDKLNPMYSIYAPIPLTVGTEYPFRLETHFSPYRLARDFDELNRGFELVAIVRKDDRLIKQVQQHSYTSVSPRFCLIKPDYEQVVYNDTVWTKKYPLSPITIKTRITSIVKNDDFDTKLYPIMRTFITFQK